MKAHLLVPLLPVLLLAACGEPSAPAGSGGRGTSTTTPARTPLREWDAPPSYTFEFRSRCGEQNLIGTFRVAVENGVVVQVKGLDRSGELAAKVLGDDFPSLAELLGYAVEAESSNADVVAVEFDQGEGYPRRIDIDYNREAIDDESCFVITDYKAPS